MLCEVDEVDEDGVEAAADYYQGLLNGTLPQAQAEKIALEQFNVVLEDKLLNQIMGQFVCSSLSIEDCVRAQLERHKLI